MTPNNTTIRRRKNKLHKERKSQLLNGSKSNPKDASSNNAAQEARDITSSLRRTKTMMQQELDRMFNVTETIDRDGQMLQETKDEHIVMKGGIKGAKGSFARLKLKDKEDDIIFWSSVVFFYIAVFYVLWTRIRIPFLMW